MNRIATSSPAGALSDRERAVAEKFASGLTYREIGSILRVTASRICQLLRAGQRKLKEPLAA